jgi:hypothetical protein
MASLLENKDWGLGVGLFSYTKKQKGKATRFLLV